MGRAGKPPFVKAGENSKAHRGRPASSRDALAETLPLGGPARGPHRPRPVPSPGRPRDERSGEGRERWEPSALTASLQTCFINGQFRHTQMPALSPVLLPAAPRLGGWLEFKIHVTFSTKSPPFFEHKWCGS